MARATCIPSAGRLIVTRDGDRWRCLSTRSSIKCSVHGESGGAAPWQRLGRNGRTADGRGELAAATTRLSEARTRASTVSRTSPSPIRLLDTEMCGVCVAYQGSPGTVIEAVVLKAFSMCTAVPHKRFEAALEAVESSLADIVVLPIENSYTGSFHQSYDILLSHDLQIVQEVQMDVELCLLALPGVHKDDLKKIFSHPQYLAQCEHSISNLSVSKKDVDHGAAGAEIISKKNLRDTGVIGSARAAELYGLNILECNFQDESPNVTRYLVLAKTANLPQEHGQYKTSVVFGLEEGPGTLYKAIGAFWKRGINLTKIESRPNRGKPMRTRGTEKKLQVSCVSLAAIRTAQPLPELLHQAVSVAPS
ncbi:arogenate dehydratase/prephenate dehydratase 1, chloroplastic-like isoform X3 [Miscanthus floridulus]|uniref:arogenate dehydratase/prephenate dehydratase 1, chloroplastic-like isoform X3 n=1 Tax=Miscanthus floridulus TaxID=154761 RepID=UPI00345A2FF4